MEKLTLTVEVKIPDHGWPRRPPTPEELRRKVEQTLHNAGLHATVTAGR